MKVLRWGTYGMNKLCVASSISILCNGCYSDMQWPFLARQSPRRYRFHPLLRCDSVFLLFYPRLLLLKSNKKKEEETGHEKSIHHKTNKFFTTDKHTKHRHSHTHAHTPLAADIWLPFGRSVIEYSAQCWYKTAIHLLLLNNKYSRVSANLWQLP